MSNDATPRQTATPAAAFEVADERPAAAAAALEVVGERMPPAAAPEVVGESSPHLPAYERTWFSKCFGYITVIYPILLLCIKLKYTNTGKNPFDSEGTNLFLKGSMGSFLVGLSLAAVTTLFESNPTGVGARCLVFCRSLSVSFVIVSSVIVLLVFYL